MKISVTIITLNEEENLSRCLQSVQGLADEIIVVDSGSKDQTCQIASSWGAQVVKRGWTNYSDQKWKTKILPKLSEFRYFDMNNTLLKKELRSFE